MILTNSKSFVETRGARVALFGIDNAIIEQVSEMYYDIGFYNALATDGLTSLGPNHLAACRTVIKLADLVVDGTEQLIFAILALYASTPALRYKRDFTTAIAAELAEAVCGTADTLAQLIFVLDKYTRLSSTLTYRTRFSLAMR